jgi:hypothetical protein
MLYFLVMIINLNTTYRELATSFHCPSRANPIMQAPWVSFGTVHGRLVSTTSTRVNTLLLGLANRFGSAYSKGILVLPGLGLDGIE